MKLARLFVLKVFLSVLGVLFVGPVFSQQTAVVRSEDGNKVFLDISPILLQGNLDTLFSNIQQLGDDIDNLSWADVLENGTTPGVDVNFFGYDALGLGQVTTTGTFTGDSLVLAKDATIAGRLSVTGVSSLSDSLTVAGFVSLGDSLEVVRAVSIGETLYVTGVTSLGDSLHVAGNVNMAQLLNVVGAATFESTVDVSGETTLNDTLHVNAVTLLNDSLHVVGGADFDASVNIDGDGAVGGTLGVTGATTLSSTLAVTGVTSLADSLHVAGGSDVDGTFNADGATTLGSTLTVSGITTLNDSLQVNSSVDVTGDFNLGGELQSAALRADSSIAQGGTASNYFTTALGSLSSASGIGAVAAGYTASASGTQSAAIGTYANASGINAVAIGESAQASATQGVAVGKSAQVSGNYANVAVGVNSQVTAGWGNTAIGGGKVNGSTGAPTYNLALGYSTISTAGAFNVALGANSTISGNGSTANSMTFGPYSTVDGGFRNIAMGASASIGGASNSNYAMGDYSSVMGAVWHSYALGDHSKVQANGHHALAFGPYSEVSAFNAANFAYDSPARFSHQAIFGAYADTTVMVPGSTSHNDWIGTDPLFVVANGATESSRSNALLIRKDGAALFSDSLHVAGNVSFAQTLTVDGATSLNDSLYVGGNTSLAGTLNVTGVTSLADSLHVAGGADFDGDVNIDGTTSMTNTNISGNTTMGGTLTVNGETTLNDTLHANAPALFSDSIHVAGGASFAGTVDVTNLRIGGTTIPPLDNTDALPEGDSNLYFTADREAALQAQIDVADSVNQVLAETIDNLLNQLFDPATITTGAVTSIGANGGTLNATFDGGGLQVEEAGFIVSSTSNFADSTVYPVLSTGATDFSEVVSDLATAQTYYCKAFVRTLLNTAVGSPVTFQTVGDVVMTSNAATVNGQTTTAISATITDTGGGTVSATGFKYSTSADLSGAATIGGSSTSGTFSANLSGLTRETVYYYAPYSTNEAGTAYGDTLSFTTWNACDNQSSVLYNGYSYSIVGIGSQCWFAENLRSTQFSDGSNIMNMVNDMYSPPNGNAGNVGTYGYIYQWPWNTAAMCPSGWSIPSTGQFDALNTHVAGDGAALKASSTSWNGTNSTGFNALPAGRGSHPGVTGGNILSYFEFEAKAYFWTSTNAVAYSLDATSNGFAVNNYGTWPMPVPQVSIRCVKN